MKDLLYSLKNEAVAQIISAKTLEELEQLRIHYLGKKGALNDIAKKISGLEQVEKISIGQIFNDVKTSITSALESSPLKVENSKLKIEYDLSLPGIRPAVGHLHPVTYAIEEISEIFEKIGFNRVRYPEVEWDWFAFNALNFPDNHPARDDWETFFVEAQPSKKFGKMLLTPHTSSGQIREMQRVATPPVRMINIAKCYRRQSDVSHTVMFHQFEGLVVDQGINITNLKGTIDHFAKAFFGPNRVSRLRPYNFLFTEPSFEVDISCGICNGKGCRLCKEGWLELGGAGMVHPNVLKACEIDSKKYTGFAFGWGVERSFMMKADVKIDDIRLLYGNDIRFLSQF